MLSQQIKDSGSLLDSVDAVRNWRALALLLVTLVAAALVMGLGSLLAGVSLFFVFLFMLAAYAVMFYGANAVGMMMMDEARGLPSRPMGAALAQALSSSHRLILVFLLVGALYVVGLIALALVLLLCKIPFLGPVLYAFVFPVAVVVAGVAMFALPTVVFPLSAPAIWNGAGTLQCVSQLLAIARRKLLMVLILMVAVTFIAGVVAFLIGSILFAGTVTVAGMSAPILGGMGGMGALMMGGAMGMGGMGGAGMGHAVAAGIGGGMLFAAAFTLPGLVYLRGASTVYLRAVEGLDLAAEQAVMDERIAAARAKAGAVQEQVRARAQQAAERARAATEPPRPAPVPAPAPVAPAAPAGTPPAAPPVPATSFPSTVQASPPTYAPPPVFTPPPTPDFGATPAPAALLRCPACTAVVQPDDTFCGDCGHKLT